jgi:ATP-dependent RNA helicase DHX57
MTTKVEVKQLCQKFIPIHHHSYTQPIAHLRTPLDQMAPKRRPANVVRSGNAGNSTKPTPKTEEPNGVDPNIPPRPPPLFPAGYKTPVSVLNEKCQKAGWERPLVDARPNGAKWTGVVTLQKRVSKNIYELEKVRLEPRPGLEIDTAQEAKHWAATYALFRVSHSRFIIRSKS